MTKFKVFDDFISPTYQNILQAIFLAENTRWSYQEHMNYGNSGLSQFYISIFDERMIEHVELYHSLLGLVSKIKDDIVPEFNPIRIRGILQTSINNPPKHYIPHIDSPTNDWSFIYYINDDATGDTYLFHRTIANVSNGNENNYKWNHVDSVSPKKGRLIMFPSKQYHAGSPPDTGKRMLINFNYSK